MSDDIVERLVNADDGSSSCPGCGWGFERNHAHGCYIEDAINEIERLRHELGEAHMNLAMCFPEGGRREQ
jgi:hypothetical protein